MAKYRYKLAGGSRIQSRNSGHLFWPRDRLDNAGFAVREPGLRGAFFIEEFQGLSSGRQSFEERAVPAAAGRLPSRRDPVLTGASSISSMSCATTEFACRSSPSTPGRLR